jgi:hypothetical protein
VAWKQHQHVVLAGLFHSVYSTEAFGQGLLQLSDRDAVRSVIGERAERLVYAFCAIHRATFIDAVEQWNGEGRRKLGLRDRYTGDVLDLSAGDVGDVLILLMANEAEQSCGPDGEPSAWLARIWRLAALARTHAATLPPILDECRGAITAAAEEALLRAYTLAINERLETFGGLVPSLEAAAQFGTEANAPDWLQPMWSNLDWLFGIDPNGAGVLVEDKNIEYMDISGASSDRAVLSTARNVGGPSRIVLVSNASAAFPPAI